MSKWDELTMAEKAEMIGVAVRNGITNLQDIREKYNEFAEGGSVDTDWSYNSWKKQIAEHMGIRPDEDNTYDYEAYFNKYPEEAWKMLKGDPTAHFSDEFKTVYHPTFSSKSFGNDGSIYSGVRNPKTNPQGLVGGTWSPDYKTFTMSPDGYRGPVSMDDRKWYLENAEDNGIVLREADGSLPVYDGIPWGGVLPNIIINGSRRGRKFEDGGFTSELDWSPDSWFSKRVAKPDGTLYNDEEAARLASHVPEYNNIEQTAKANGTWLKMSDGSIWKGDPRSWVMMQSESYKKNYSPKPWYTGQAEWPTTFDYGKGKVDTNKVTRAPYYNNQMWFSDSEDYGQTFADYQNSTGLGWRFDTPGEEDIKGHNFLSAIPKEGNYRTLESPANGRPDQWQRLPFVLEDGTINRLPESQISVDSKGRNIRADKQKVLTDDVVNWSKDLGDQGIFMQNIDDGAIIKNGEILRQPVNEFISQPGFTDKVKFIEGNTGDFDIDNPYKYANNFYDEDTSLDNNYAALGGPIFRYGSKHSLGGLLFEAAMNEYKKGGSIHISPSKRGTFTAAAKKHGKSVQAFASQVLAHPENYSPAMRKKANFARNSRRWKHGLGGNLFDGTSRPSQQMQIGLDVQGWPNYTTEQIIANGERVQQQRQAEANKSFLEKLQDILDTKVQVQATPGTATGYATTGQYMPKSESTVGRQLIEGAATVASPFIPSATLTLSPSSAFWMNPITRQVAASTLGGKAVDLATTTVTPYSSWGEGISNVVNQTTGWNPQDSWYGNMLMDMTNPGYLTPYSLVESGANKAIEAVSPINRAVKNTVDNIERRAIETGMRTTPYANALPYVKEGVKSMLRGEDGGKQRLLHIGNYILTGNRIGPKGYYNSAAGFTPLNDSGLLVEESPIKTIQQKWQNFKNPKGLSSAYSGFVNSSGHVPLMTERKDMIDAFLYGEEIDPTFGLNRIAIGSDFGPHTGYVAQKYVSKAHDIPVYEMNTPNPTSEEKIKNIRDWEGVENGLFRGNNGDYLNVAGHIARKGLVYPFPGSNGYPVTQRQDIWKFNPEDYYERWLKDKTDYEKMSPFARKLTMSVLKEVDRLGTPVITRTKWNSAGDFGW